MDEKSVREGIEEWLLWKKANNYDEYWQVILIDSLLKDLESAAKIGFFPWEVFTKGNQG